jgi:drug/metabolite transporter (DMT)-like permease
VPLSALGLALAAALLHASWNTLAAGAEQSQPTLGVSLVFGGLVLALVVLLTGFDAGSGVWPFAVASVAFRLVYLALLASAYQRGPLSVVYPISRGVGPVVVLAVSAGVLGASLSPLQAAGVLLVAFGVIAVSGLSRPADLGDLGRALVIGACIGGYTLVDNEGVHRAEPLSYLLLVTLPTGVAYVATLVRTSGAAPLRAELGPKTALMGIAMVSAYGLVLAALKLAPAAPVAAVRETSVVIATGMAAVFLHERVGPLRALGAAVVAAGVATLALG